MRLFQKILLVSTLGLLAPFAASAQSVQEMQAMSPEDRRAFMDSMSEDERSAMRDKWRGEFDGLSDEDKDALRQKNREQRGGREGSRDREAMRERWNSMSEEERTVATERRKAQSAERKAKWDGMSDEQKAAAREQRGKGKGGGDQRGKGQGGNGANQDKPEAQQ